MQVPVTKLKRGQIATVTQVNTDGKIFLRMCDIGIVPGSKIAYIAESPFKDPIYIAVRGTCFAVGLSVAKNIIVRPDVL